MASMSQSLVSNASLVKEISWDDLNTETLTEESGVYILHAQFPEPGQGKIKKNGEKF